MEKWWFNSMLFNRELEYRCGLSKSMDSFGPIENTSVSEDPILTDMDKNRSDSDNSSSSYSNVDYLVGVENIRNFISDDTFLVRDSNRDSYSIYFDIENQIFEIDNDHSFLSELECFFYSYKNFSYLNNVSKSYDPDYDHYMYDTKYSWNNHIHNCIDSYLRSKICIDGSILSDSDKYNDSYISSYICGKGRNISERWNSSRTNATSDSALTRTESSNHLEETQDLEETQPKTLKDFRHLWVQCENEDCYKNNYKSHLKSRMNMCEYCGYHLKMSSSDRIELLIDEGTWNPMDEDMVSVDPIEFNIEEEPSPSGLFYVYDKYHKEPSEESYKDPYPFGIFYVSTKFYKELSEQSYKEKEPSEESSEEPYEQSYVKYYEEISEQYSKEPSEESSEEPSEESSEEPSEESYEEPYKDRIDSYQTKTGLTDAVQTGTGQLNGIPVAIGVMDFQFIGGSMGSVVGEKITRLIEYAANQFLPLILVCASGGARMQEGSLSLMQMAKISSALYDYQVNKKLFYVSILTSPTTGGVTASFAMLGDIIIAEPNAHIAFAGKRVIEQTLNITVPEGLQEAEYLFQMGSVDSIVPRKLLKGVLSELFQLHAFFPLTPN